MPSELIDYGANYGKRLAIEITGANDATNGGLGEIANPFGGTVLIRDAMLVTKTASTGAANIRLGIGASGTNPNDIAADTAINGLAANHVYNCFVRQNTGITQNNVPALWTAATNIQVTGSANSTGYRGFLLLDIIVVPD